MSTPHELSALNQLKHELSNAPHEEKSAFVHVQRLRPELVDDDEMLKFLEAEEFDVAVSYVSSCDALLV